MLNRRIASRLVRSVDSYDSNDSTRTKKNFQSVHEMAHLSEPKP